MRVVLILSIATLLRCLVASSDATALHAATALSPKNYQLINGQWFDGACFQPGIFYAVDGLLTRTRPPVVDAVIDLTHGFVVPPFAEAHNHNVEGAWNIDAENLV